jgi:hypothetical protein
MWKEAKGSLINKYSKEYGDKIHNAKELYHKEWGNASNPWTGHRGGYIE